MFSRIGRNFQFCCNNNNNITIYKAHNVRKKLNLRYVHNLDIDYAHATLSTVHIMSMSSTKRLLIDWIIMSNVVLI